MKRRCSLAFVAAFAVSAVLETFILGAVLAWKLRSRMRPLPVPRPAPTVGGGR